MTSKLGAALTFGLLCLVAVSLKAQEIPESWPRALTDPGAEGNAPADLILPMPCGAEMAFQQVDVPVEATDPLADRRMQMGLSGDTSGYSDYLRPAFLRGPFDAENGATTYYYIARYELTAGQVRVLQGDCAPPRVPADRMAAAGLSWFDAVNLAAAYTSWLYEFVPETLPTRDGALGFIRLPTEDEWEYAARGGAAVDPTVFPGRHYFVDDTVADHGNIFAPGSGRGRVFPVGLRLPNPLGLFDIYGNVEELMLEPFRLNIVGRSHGQPGGIVTRGGSTFDAPDQIYTAKRAEYSPFDPRTGAPRAGEAFGVRMVISAHVTTSDPKLQAIQSAWNTRAGTLETALETGADREDPLARLSALIEAELDPARKQALAVLQLDIRQAQTATQTALAQTADASLLAGAAFVEAINRTASEMETHRSNVLTLLDISPTGDTSAMFRNQISALQRRLDKSRELQCTLLTSFRSTLTALTTEVDTEIRRKAYSVLREDLILSNRTLVLNTLDEFWLDIALFELQPDASTLDLLSFALTRPMSNALRDVTRC